MLPIDFHPAARHDYDQAFDWYAERSPAVAARFTNALDATLGRITQQPAMCAYVDQLHQACSVRKFPFRVIFRKLERQILIVAIAHAQRRPNYWQDRVPS